MRSAPRLWLRALAMVTLALAGVFIALSGVRAQDGEPVVPAAVDASVKPTLQVSTPTSGGWITSTGVISVINGQIVTFRLTFANTTGATASGLNMSVTLPDSGLDTIACAANDLTCEVLENAVTIINALGEEEERMVPYEVTFSLGNVANGVTVMRTFTARIVGQAGGTTIESTAAARYSSNVNTVSNKLTMEVVADFPSEPVMQANAVSATPNWFSDDVGGTLDLDWADVDLDGDLDLALASTVGTAVYLNNNGQLQPIWLDPESRVTYGVRWLDVDKDGTPELIAVGTPVGDVAGTNYVFKYNEGDFESPDRFQVMTNGEFPTENQLTRIETGDFDGDGYPDLLLSVNAISAECPVFILKNDPVNLFKTTPECVSSAATAAIQTGDVNGDGLVDLALGVFPNQIRVIVNDSGVISQTNPINIPIDVTNKFLPYDFVWGDVDGDGALDLAAALPLQREVRIYRNTTTGVNNVSFAFLQSIKTSVFQTPYAIEFADLDRDGALDLIVGDAQPTIYWNTRDVNEPYSTQLRSVLTLTGDRSETWAIRAVDQDGNGSLELALANRSGPSMLLANYTPALASDFTPVTSGTSGGSIAWGDINNDGYNDLIVGSSANSFRTRVYYNKSGVITTQNARSIDTDEVGSHAIAVGDMNDLNGDGVLDIAVLMPTGLVVSYNGGTPQSIAIPGLELDQERTLVAGDMDGDGDLDLAVGLSPGGLYIVENRSGESDSSPNVFKVEGAPDNIYALDWGDVNNDHYLDLAVGTDNGLKILVNNSGGRFTALADNKVVQTKGFTCLQGRVQALAWGDVTGDGWADLAVGTNGRPGCVMQNDAGALSTTQQFSAALRNVTALDWGDWDNDGDLDLAVGHASGPVQVHANTGGRLFLLWQSSASYVATGVRWGDKDGDSDLDLALSRANGDSGYFENRLVEPGHLLASSEVSLLPNPSAYVYVKRPGETRNAYQYSTSEILASPKKDGDRVEITFTLFKPDGKASDPEQAYQLLFHYSLDSGGTWQEASAWGADGDPETPPPMIRDGVYTTTLTQEGEQLTFIWDAREDEAIAEKALFRVSVINPSSGSTVQSATGKGISPPFQVRATTCTWPAGPSMLVNGVQAIDGRVFTPSDGSAYASIRFNSLLSEGDGRMTYTWTLNTGATKRGQQVTFLLGKGDYVMTLTADGEACPTARFASTTYSFSVGGGIAYLPLGMNGAAESSAAGDIAASAAQQTNASSATIIDTSGDATQLSTAGTDAEIADPILDLDAVFDDVGLTLSWRLDEAADVQAIRIYRQRTTGAGAFLDAELSPEQESYTTARACGVVYTVVATGAEREIPAQQEYRTPVCETGGAE